MNIPISTGFLEKNIFKERVKQGHLDIITLSEVRERQTSYDITYLWNLKKNDTNDFIYKTEIDSQT